MRTHCLLLSLLVISLGGPGLAVEEGPVASWRFDSTGPQVADLSGHRHTAALSGGQVLTEAGQSFLRLDGKTRIEVPAAPELSLRSNFTIEARLRPSDLVDGRLLLFKDREYLLRIDWPVESSRLSCFLFLDGAWEPRTSAFKLPPNEWYHLAATWDGSQLQLWVNGLPHQGHRAGTPVASDSPLLIGSAAGFGQGFVGDLDYVRIYNRTLTSAEIIKSAYGASGRPLSPPSTAAGFDFRGGAQGWAGREGATVAAGPEGLAVRTGTATSLAMHDRLSLDLERRDFVCLRLSVDRGAYGALIFVTDKSAGRMPFSVIADGRPHTYILEPWQFPGWSGRLVGLGISPSDAAGTTAQLRYVRVTGQPEGEGEVQLLGLTTDSVLPRVKRPERLTLRLVNNGAALRSLKLSLRAPAGVKLQGAAAQTVRALDYQQPQEVSWSFTAAAAGRYSFRVEAEAPGITPVSLSSEVPLGPALTVPRADYVPRPVPARMGKYQVWTHYCPLWKQGTHRGWQAIEPYPERKPVLGWYNEGTPEVADWHIKYWLEHGISAAIYCWYRSVNHGPVTQSLGHAIHDGLLKARYLNMIKFGIMWENGCGAGTESPEDLLNNVLPFWLDNYFTNPSYLKIDGKPVLYIWVPGNVTKHLGGSDKVRETFETMRARCRARGLQGLYIVGCVGSADRASLERMAKEGWDASSAYGANWSPPSPLKSLGRFVHAPYEGFLDQQEAIWKGKREIGALPDITAAMMGWDSRPWNETSFFWSGNTPEKFRELCRRAKAAMDARSGSGPDRTTAIFCCWNEFGEGHYIEPTRGYGFAYLDAIRDTFSESPRAHTDLAPEDVGLGPYDSWYRAAKALAAAGGVATATSWTGATLGAWSPSMGLDQVSLKEGVLRAVSVTPDPAFSIADLAVRSGRFGKVTVEMRVSQGGDAQGGHAQLFWTNAAVPGARESASAHVETVADGQFHRYSFPVGSNEYWGGCLTSLRLDPTDASGVTIEIRSITLE